MYKLLFAKHFILLFFIYKLLKIFYLLYLYIISLPLLVKNIICSYIIFMCKYFFHLYFISFACLYENLFVFCKLFSFFFLSIVLIYREVKTYILNISSEADDASEDAQMDCYGFGKYFVIKKSQRQE